MEQIRQTQSIQLREESRLQALQVQSVMEQYMESMREDMRAIKAENKELREIHGITKANTMSTK